MPVLFASLARCDGTVLAHHVVVPGNISDIASSLLQQHVVASPDARVTITCDKHNFFYLKTSAALYCAVADESAGRQVPAACLDRIREAWEGGSYPQRAQRGAPHSFDRAFGPRLREYLEHFNAHPTSVDRIAAVRGKIDETKGVMLENVERVVVRGEKLEMLQERTEDLAVSALAFRKQARTVKQAVWWQGAKVKAALFGSLALIIAVVIIVLICFKGANRCVPKRGG